MPALNHNSIMHYGKYRGKKMIDIPAPYFLWLYENACWDVDVKNYIKNNLELLRKENAKIQQVRQFQRR